MYIIEICKLYSSNIYLISILNREKFETNNDFLDLYVKLQEMRTDLARIESTIPPTGANKYVWNVLDVTRVSIHCFAYGIIDNRYCNLL